MKTTLALLAALIGTGLCNFATAADVDAKRISESVRVLASDEFEGRSPGIAAELANSRRWPQWRTDSEFNSLRQRSDAERR